MEKKYIIKLEENEIAYKTVNSNGCPMIGLLHPEPYTEPDLEQVRADAYRDGYKVGREAGIKDGMRKAWETARKIWDYDLDTLKEIFGKAFMRMDIYKSFTASEAIEKIRQYEQGKEEIKVGNEVKSGDEKYIVLQKYLNNIDELMVVLFNRRDGQIGTWHMYNANGAIFEKTGRHFQEIAEVLRKMKES